MFCLIEYNNFEAASLLLKYGTRIDNKNIDFKNIIEYLIEKRKIDLENLFYVLNTKKNIFLLTTEVLFQLIY